MIEGAAGRAQAARTIRERAMSAVRHADRRPANGLCVYFAVETVRFIRERGERAVLQAGSCQWPIVRPEDDDGVGPTHFGYVWSPEAAASRHARTAGALGEVHAWAGIPARSEIVDLTTGEFPAQALRLCGIHWKAPSPPEFLWGVPPGGAIYEARADAIAYVLGVVARIRNPRFALELVD